jgi:hypothetical protein
MLAFLSTGKAIVVRMNTTGEACLRVDSAHAWAANAIAAQIAWAIGLRD